jgi:hypothetical protein
LACPYCTWQSFRKEIDVEEVFRVSDVGEDSSDDSPNHKELADWRALESCALHGFKKLEQVDLWSRESVCRHLLITSEALGVVLKLGDARSCHMDIGIWQSMSRTDSLHHFEK